MKCGLVYLLNFRTFLFSKRAIRLQITKVISRNNALKGFLFLLYFSRWSKAQSLTYLELRIESLSYTLKWRIIVSNICPFKLVVKKFIVLSSSLAILHTVWSFDFQSGLNISYIPHFLNCSLIFVPLSSMEKILQA